MVEKLKKTPTEIRELALENANILEVSIWEKVNSTATQRLLLRSGLKHSETCT